jgi:hypothetical protein
MPPLLRRFATGERRMDPPTDLIRMVELFRENLQAYQSDEFNEAALRLQFKLPCSRTIATLL